MQGHNLAMWQSMRQHVLGDLPRKEQAFGNLLTDVHDFALTTPIMQAMAIVANVVINLPDVDVNYDDVRKAFAKPGGKTRGKNSRRLFQNGGKLNP